MDIERKVKEKADSVGQTIYDLSASWFSVLFFFMLCLAWIVVNSSLVLGDQGFDPYPYNMLKLILTFISAVQAPLLLMYSRKSTEFRKNLLEKDYNLAKKTIKRIKRLEKLLKKRGSNEE